MADPIRTVGRASWRGGAMEPGYRTIPEEVAVAFTFGGSSYAVMMATPRDLEDFAVGFSLTEGIIQSPDEIEELEIIEQAIGVELRMQLREPHARGFQERRRYLAGPTGCGLCGIESLDEAMRALPAVIDEIVFTPADIMNALEATTRIQSLHKQTFAMHGAAFYDPTEGLIALREDVGRHNALDKLSGALARAGRSGGGGIGILTSRLSVEMIQKAAAIRLPCVVAVSAPTALAVRTADEAGITLIAVARSDGFEVFTHSSRIGKEVTAHLAGHVRRHGEPDRKVLHEPAQGGRGSS